MKIKRIEPFEFRDAVYFTVLALLGAGIGFGITILIVKHFAW